MLRSEVREPTNPARPSLRALLSLLLLLLLKLWRVHQPDKKDKMESDLKKELKKLQKLRDQIRGWASSGDVKDTEALLAARRSIEVNMERFKVGRRWLMVPVLFLGAPAFERESKTKAFSKEGLARTGRRFNDDPEEQAKAQAREILNEYIDRLQVQVSKVGLNFEQPTCDESLCVGQRWTNSRQRSKRCPAGRSHR
eukprot:scaffold375_cov378-Prasinococcus_capsulatus_cf.AAC.12